MQRLRAICSSWGAIVFLLVVALVSGYYAIKPYIPETVPAQVDTAPVLPSPTPSVSNDEHEPRPGPTPTETPTIEISDPRGKPVKMAIFQDGKQLIGMNVQKNGTSNGDDFQSQCGKTTWYSATGWPKPGVESRQKSLITGHMKCGETEYSINKLKSSRKGAILKVTSDTGCVIVARATIDATNIQKSELNERDELLYNKELARIIRVSTCDDEAKKDAQGHSTKNYYQMFEVISVTCPS